ncbi:MAG: FKBP-type peptidyl-prolyl cis-trans isomerase [Bacteroidales bacterium]
MRISSVAIGLFTAVFITICSFSAFAQEKPWSKTQSGLKYIFHKSVPNARKPAIGDVVEVRMIYKTSADSILFDYRKIDQPFIHVLEPSVFKADFNEALSLMGSGDSATFLIKADSFYLKTLRMDKLPAFIKKGSEMTFNIKLNKVTPNEEYMKEQMALVDNMRSKAEESRKKESELLNRYLEFNKIATVPTETGLHFISEREGNGPQPAKGNIAVIDYTAHILDGKEFESTAKTAPLEFKMGAHTVIKGLEEAVGMMKKGGKAKVIIPSYLAYNGNEVGSIPPFSTLIYDIELIDVKQ